jgi:hypothetical protein
MDELAIAQSMQLGGSADAHNPQGPELALPLLAPGIGEFQRAIDRFFGGAVEF